VIPNPVTAESSSSIEVIASRSSVGLSSSDGSIDYSPAIRD
jgi:hypothetical protein